MTKTCLLLLYAASFVETLITVTGRVGENVSFTCSDWRVLWVTNAKSSDKYLCESPCRAKDIIAMASPGKSGSSRDGRIHIGNSQDALYVSITNLQKSDSKTYICGLDRWFYDAKIKVHVIVDDAEPPTSSTTAQTAVEEASESTLPSAVLDTSTTSALSYDFMAAVSPSPKAFSSSVEATAFVVTVVLTTIMVVMALLIFWCKQKEKSTSSSIADPQEQTEVLLNINNVGIAVGKYETDSGLALTSTVLYALCQRQHPHSL